LIGNYPAIELSGSRGRDVFEVATTFRDKTVTYGKATDEFVISIFLKQEAGSNRRFYVNLAAYNPRVDFPRMPFIPI